MMLLKRVHYLIAILILPACQLVEKRNSTGNEQNLASYSLPAISLLSKTQKQGGWALTREDERRAQQVLEMNFTKQSSTWLAGSNKEISLTMVPIRTYQEVDGTDCREYKVKTIQKEGLATSEIACRYGINQWKVVISKRAQAKAKAEKEAQARLASLEDISSPATKKMIEHGVTADWIIQMGSFLAKDDTAELIGRLEKHGYSPYAFQATAYGAIVYRVNLDVQGDQSKVKEIVDELKNELGLSPFFSRNH